MNTHANDAASEETTATGTLTPSSSSLPILPYEIVIDILLRLPVKSLMRFQCVCKSFKSLITDPSFAKKHLHASATRHQRFLLSITQPSPEEFATTSYPLSSSSSVVFTPTQLECPPLGNNFYYTHIHGYCNGIFCILYWGPRDPSVRHPNFFILWNPSIRKYTRLPRLENANNLSFSFGYDRSTDTYKVVVISISRPKFGYNNALTHVLTMGTNFWRRIQDSPRFPCDSGKFHSGSGTLNWLTNQSIISLDLEKESYRELLVPSTYVTLSTMNCTLCVLRDCLCLVRHHSTSSDVWLMNEHGNDESWTKVIRLQANDISRVLYLYEDDQVLLEFRSSEKLAVYDSRDGTVKTLEIQNNFSCKSPQVYQETLISPVLNSNPA